jgi:arsenite methyltransferase
MERTLDQNISDLVDVDGLRREVREKYREVATHPTAEFHFHTGRARALRMGHAESSLMDLPDARRP